MKLKIITSITLLIVGTTPTIAKAEKISCFRNGDVISCPNYGTYNYRNSVNNNNNNNSSNTEATITEYYQQILGRNPDSKGLRQYTNAVDNNRTSLKQVRLQLVNSTEAKQAINKIYQEEVGRDANNNELENCRISLDKGSSLAQVRSDLVDNNNNRYNNNNNNRYNNSNTDSTINNILDFFNK